VSLVLPAALWGLLLLPVVVLLRLLARRPRVLVVPSLIPWRNSASASLSDRRRSLLLDVQLLLQLIAVGAAVFAAAGPGCETRGPAERRVAVVVDNSASMAAGDRRDSGHARLREELDALDGDLAGSLWVTSPVPRRVAGPDADRGSLREALLSAQPLPAAGDLAGAISNARREAGDDALLIVVTDDVGSLEGLEVPQLVSIKGGGAARNLGIVAAAIEDGRAFCAVRSNSPVAEEVGVKMASGETSVSLKGKIPAGGRTGFTFDLPEEPGRFVEFKVVPVAGPDTLAADDFVTLGVSPEPQPVAAPAGGRSVERIARAFSALGFPGAVEVAPGREAPGARLLFTCGRWPKSVAAGSFAIVCDPPPGALPALGIRAGTGRGPATAELGGDEYFPHAGGFRFDIDSACELRLAPGAEPILADGQRTLIALSAGGRACVLAFDPEETGWIKHASFPVFFERLVARVPALAAMRRASFRTGEKAPGGFAGRLTAPDGRTVRPGELLRQTGLYRSGREAAFAVNLLSEVETACASGGREVRRVLPVRPRLEKSTPLAPWLFALALVCLAAEWFLAWRGRVT